MTGREESRSAATTDTERLALSTHKHLLPGAFYDHEGDCAGTYCEDCGCCYHCLQTGDCGCPVNASESPAVICRNRSCCCEGGRP